MKYTSTRDSKKSVSSAKAIYSGISDEGGLYLPESIPTITADEWDKLYEADYLERAKLVLSKYLTDFSADELTEYLDKAYMHGKFDDDIQTPISKLNDKEYFMELWHGPTCAFKDMALQLLPYLLTASIKKEGDADEVVILVATSGDTGKAALEGFRDVNKTNIMVFYPEDGVSQVQKRQMVTQEGENVGVCAIKGNFDDAQTGVKKIFTDARIKDILKQHGKSFSSANSINWGRLVPQIVYYVSAYAELVKTGEIKAGDKINFVVPTGNFGNILAAYFAKEMGTPVNKLICASNSNNVLTDFMQTGEYNRNRKFYTTMSPSMDILISSNLERLVYLLAGRDSERTAQFMAALRETGKYVIDDSMKSRLDESFFGGYANEEKTAATIKEIFDRYGYLCDTHTAVAVGVYEDYVKKTGDDTKSVIVSTASPYKFVKSVLKSLKGSDISADNEFDMVGELSALTATAAPKALTELKDKQVRFTDVCTDDTMEDYVLSFLKIK